MLKELIKIVEEHPFIKNPKPEIEAYKDFRKAWGNMTEYFWSEYYKKDPEATWEERHSIPSLDFVYTSKTAFLYGFMNHDVNSSLLYYIRREGEAKFDFKELWDNTLIKIVEIFKKYADGKDIENPDTIKYLVYWGGKLIKAKVSVYNVTGTIFWRRAWFITTEEQRVKELKVVEEKLQNIIEEEKRYKEKYGRSQDYYFNKKNYFENQVKVLRGEISNDESMLRIMKIKEEE